MKKKKTCQNITRPHLNVRPMEVYVELNLSLAFSLIQNLFFSLFNVKAHCFHIKAEVCVCVCVCVSTDQFISAVFLLKKWEQNFPVIITVGIYLSNNFGKYIYFLSCQELQKKINATLMSVH